MKATICPVPKEQIPIIEYQQLIKSSFFKWPILGKKIFYKNLIICWLIILPIIITIFSGSIQLRGEIIKLLSLSLSWSLLLPILLICRHLLSWKYIYKRLYSEKIEYEESGWYDGQIWEKNIEMREKDLLTSQHDIKPILHIVNESLIITIILFISSSITIQFLL
tara:strand:+ start:46564 stop:47058 length:495 start_codon:yes stop_codon:yes gene_type:complete